MVPQTLSRALLHLSLLSISLLLTGCPGLRDALPSMLAASQPNTASAHEFTLPGRNGAPAPTIPVIEPIHARDDYSSYRIESAMSSIADLTHPHRVASLPISLRDIALLRNDPYLADPSAPIPPRPFQWRGALPSLQNPSTPAIGIGALMVNHSPLTIDH